MSHRSTRRPMLWARHSIVHFLTFAVLTGSFVAGLARMSSAITVYNRTAAVAYANANYNKVVTDGYFYETSYPPTFVGLGNPPIPPGVTGDDCAHFVSSSIGSPGGRGVGGGLTIPNRAGTYGEPGAARLDALLVGNDAVGGYGTTYQYGVLVNSVSQLTPGDVIGYDWTGNGNGSMSGIDHTALYIGNNLVDCHSNSKYQANWTLGGASNYFFIHITLPDAITPNAPNAVTPTASTFVSSLTPQLSASAFSDGAIGSTHVAAQWQIFNGATLVYDSGTDTRNLTGLTVPAGKLAVGNTYSWKVRYEDNYSGWSPYSSAASLSISMPGDYNNDGLVDSADYVLWRNNPTAFGGTVNGYNSWRTNLGASIGSGTAIGSDLSASAVPEPTAAFLMLAGCLFSAIPRRR